LSIKSFRLTFVAAMIGRYVNDDESSNGFSMARALDLLAWLYIVFWPSVHRIRSAGKCLLMLGFPLEFSDLDTKVKVLVKKKNKKK
jgi:hypothetical protein